MSLAFTDILNSSGLKSVLSSIDISVPARTDKRKTHHTETYTACRLLSTLAEAGRLTFPLSVSPSDRPDVVLSTGSGQIGIEITEAIPARVAELYAVGEREFPGRSLPDEFAWDSLEAVNTAEMRDLWRRNAQSSDGWLGDAPEQKWASFMGGVVQLKLGKLAKDGFRLFDKNWLTIYDNLPLPHIHLADAIGLLESLLVDFWSSRPAFDAVFIEHGQMIARVTKCGSKHFEICNLWGRQDG